MGLRQVDHLNAALALYGRGEWVPWLPRGPSRVDVHPRAQLRGPFLDLGYSF